MNNNSNRALPFLLLERPTVFISASRDMHHEAEIAVEMVAEIGRNLPAQRRLESYVWTHSDQVWRGDARWQEMIPSPADPMIVAVICLFGERLGEPMPADFPLPPDLELPPEVEFPWQGGSGGRIPLTGTLFEYLYARTRSEKRPLSQRITPLLVYVRGDGTKMRKDLPPSQRDFGYWRHYETVSRSRNPLEIAEYFKQLDFLATFLDSVHRPLERGCYFLEPETEAFRKRVLRDLVSVLDLPDLRKRSVKALKGLESYDVTDRAIFAGRGRAVDKIFSEIQRKESARVGPTAALIVGASGAGKSSVLRAGVAGEVLDGIRSSPYCHYRVLVVTPRQLAEPNPLATLGALLAGPTALPELGRPDDLQDALAAAPDGGLEKLIVRIREACAQVAVEKQRASRFGVLPAVRLIIALDQVDEIIAAGTQNPPEWSATLIHFLIQGVRQRAFWVIGSLADVRLSGWNQILGEDVSLFDYWPLGNPDWDALGEIVDSTFRLSQLPLSPQLRQELIQSCRSIDREGTANLPLLSVALARLCAAVTRLVGSARAQTFELENKREPARAPGDTSGAVNGDVTLDDEQMRSLIPLADVRSAIDELAERAWTDSTASPGTAGDSQSLDLGRLLRRLIAVAPSDSRENIYLRACSTQDPAIANFAPLIHSLKAARILVDVENGAVRIVHEAVVRHWARAQRWFDKARQALQFLEIVRPLAANWGSAPESRKRAMLLPAGYWREAQTVLVDWAGDYEAIPIDYLRASFIEHAAEIASETSENGWSPLGIAAHLGEVALVKAYVRSGAELSRGGPEGYTPLHYASNSEIAQELLREGLQVDLAAHDGFTPLMTAARNGRIEVARALLEAHARTDLADKEGFTALHHAVVAGWHEVAGLLLQHGAPVDAASQSGDTPLTLACSQGDSAIAGLLLAQGAAVTAIRADGAVPLTLAVRAHARDCVQALIQHGAAADLNSAYAALEGAAQGGAAEIVELLLSSGVPADSDEAPDTWPLFSAARYGYESVVNILLTAGADVHRATADGNTVLHAAARAGHIGIMETLLERSARVNVYGKDGVTPLHVACQYQAADVAVRLITSGADVTSEDSYGYLPLCRAVEYGDEHLLTALLSAGVSPFLTNRRGMTALDFAARRQDTALLEILLKKADEAGITPPAADPLIITAVRASYAEAVGSLCARGGVDATDFRGMTALMYACWLSRPNLVALLLQHGADAQKRGPDGWTPMMYTLAVPPEIWTEKGHGESVREILKLLKSSGARTDQRDDHGQDLHAIAHRAGSEGSVRWLDSELDLS